MAKNGSIHPTRIFKHPDELEQAWILYKKDLDNKALEWVKIQYVGKEGEQKRDPYKLPYTLEGFEIFCYENYGCVEQYFKNAGGYYDVFMPICSYIKKEIRNNQITGGMLGVFNPSITQRLNSLIEKQEIKSEIELTKTTINFQGKDIPI